MGKSMGDRETDRSGFLLNSAMTWLSDPLNGKVLNLFED